MIADELDRTQPATRSDLRFRGCKLDGTRHCKRCRRKVELWTSGHGRGFYIDVQPTGDKDVVTMHRSTCPATAIDIAAEIEPFRERHQASIVVVIGRESTTFAAHPNCRPEDARQALFAAANNLADHLRNQEQ